MAGRNPHPAAIFFVFFRKAPSDGRFRGAFSDEEGEERQQPAELAQGGGHVAFDGLTLRLSRSAISLLESSS